MLAGCSSSTLLSPRHRLRSESSAVAQFQACHFQLPSMSTQRLDLPCSFSRKENSRPQSLRPVSLSVEKSSIEATTTTCSLKQHIRLPPLATTSQGSIEARREVKGEFWERGKSLKRFADRSSVDESCVSRAKRKRHGNVNEKPDFVGEGGENLSLGQLSGGSFWFQPSFNASPIPFSITCSQDDEERVCFVPSEVVSPPLPLSKITDLGEKDVEISHGPVKEDSGSSTSSDSQSLALRLHENISEHEVGNGSGIPYPHEGFSLEASEENHHGVRHGFELVSLLMSCVEAIGSKNISAINHFIAKLGDLASPRGSTISRVVAYYTEALALRVTRLWPHVFHITTPREVDRVDEDLGTALRLLNQVSPIPKFIHFTSNEILLRAFEGKDRIHIIDFDIKQGLQWPSLFQSLASRSNPPSHVRITGIGESKQELVETGDRLAIFAGSFNLPFEFHPVVDRLEDVRLWMLHVKEGESVAVNCVCQLHKTLYDGSGGALRDFLRLIRSTNPVVLLMAEQEAHHNTSGLEVRVINSLRYYSALFDSVHSSLPLESAARVKIEEMFARGKSEILSLVKEATDWKGTRVSMTGGN
ncbi:hypothetical protein NL676_011307 [Syzygium grande]|nr:hypothetical protein NL676_011307 [Syzygium grande]